jgi:hypothetical protein
LTATPPWAQLGLGKEDEVEVLGKILPREPRWPRQRGLTREEEAELAQAVDIHQMGVVDHGDEHLALLVDLPGSLNEEFLGGRLPA